MAALVTLGFFFVVGAVATRSGRWEGDAIAPPGPGQIVRYRMDDAPQPIAVGYGAAWVSLTGFDAGGSTTDEGIWRVDASTGRTSQVPGTLGTEFLTTGEGSVWAICNGADCGGPAVLQIDPTSSTVVRTIGLPDRGAQITTGLGQVWVSLGQSGLLGVDAGTGRIDRRIDGAYDLVGVAGGSVWASNQGQGFGGLVQIDPVTGERGATFSFQDACTMEASGDALFTASCNAPPSGSVRNRMAGGDAFTGAQRFEVPIQGWGQMRLDDGVLWLARNAPDGSTITLEPHDPATGLPSGPPVEVPHGRGRFGIRMIGGPSVFFAVGEGSLWVTDFAAGELIRVGLPVPEATSGDPRCLSPDEPGLISCEQALSAAEARTPQYDVLEAQTRLTTSRVHPGSPQVRVWDVTYPDVEVRLHGPNGGCVVADWSALIDATTGRNIISGASGSTQPPCASPSP